MRGGRARRDRVRQRRLPFSLAALEEHDALAVEASSFQLRFHQTFAPRVSALLNLAQDHMDWHASFEAYRDAKRRIFDNQDGDDVHVGNRDDAVAAERLPSRVVPRGLVLPRRAGRRSGGLRRVGSSSPCSGAAGVSLGEIGAEGPAHLADAAAAAAVVLAFGVDPDAAGRALRSFPPLPHHGETVAEVGGVRFVDDSKATNPHAAVATLRGFPGAVLICGGREQGHRSVAAPRGGAGPVGGGGARARPPSSSRRLRRAAAGPPRVLDRGGRPGRPRDGPSGSGGGPGSRVRQLGHVRRLSGAGGAVHRGCPRARVGAEEAHGHRR